METNVRPIPLTITDILGALIPGFVWLFLIVATYISFNNTFFTINAFPPIETWNGISSFIQSQNIWFASVALISASFLIGYLLIPLAMPWATKLVMILWKRDKDIKEIPLEKLEFPFDVLFESTDYYKEVSKRMESIINCNPKKLYGSKLFTVARSYMRIVTPSLWEEIERRQAEVRMLGALFLSFFYSTILSSINLVFIYNRNIQTNIKTETIWWLIISVLITFVAGKGFKRWRFIEVGYTYTNALVALGYQDMLQKEVSKLPRSKGGS